jgi:Ser/Thr protein kinase RdoA (MazF antagonist)
VTRDVGRGSIGSSDRPREDLAALVDARRVATDTAARLAAELEALDPGGSAPVLIHRDFCGENMVIDRAGCLRVIDNEWFAAGPAGFDLGRAYCRWPISQPAWERFLGGYRALAPIEPSVLRFWQLAVAIWSARIRLTAGERRLTASLDVVRRLAAPGR